MNYRTPSLNKQQGLTLVELLVVSGLLALLSFIVYGALNSIMRGSAMIDNQRDTHRVARFTMMRLTKELSSTIKERLTSNGGEDNTRGVFFMENNERGSVDNDSITFVTASGAQAVFDSPGNFGYIQLRYYLDEISRDEIPDSISQNTRLTVYRLVRDEIPASTTVKKTRDSRQIVTPVADNIASLNFRYWSGSEWQDSWNNQQEIPGAIEITLAVLGSGGRVEWFKTAVSTNAALRKSN